MASEIPDRDGLAQRVTRLEEWRAVRDRWSSRIYEALPIILFTGVVIWMLANYSTLDSRLSRVEEGQVQLNQRVTSLDQRMANVEARLDQTNARIDRLGEQMAAMNTRLGEQMAAMNARLSEQMAEMNTRLGEQMAAMNTRLGGQMAEIMRALGRIEERTRQP